MVHWLQSVEFTNKSLYQRSTFYILILKVWKNNQTGGGGKFKKEIRCTLKPIIRSFTKIDRVSMIKSDVKILSP